MAQREMKTKIAVAHSIKPAAIKTSTVTGIAVDLYGYESATMVLIPGTITDGTHTPKLQHSDTSTSGDFTDCDASDLVGAFAAAATDAIQKVGYKGNKRYIRIVVTVTGSPATGGYYSSVCIKGDAARLPV